MTDTNVPACIGVIMDGNRRWAKGQGLPSLEGHRRGAEKLKEVSRWAHDAGIGTVIFYAFSTENWNRTQEEVRYMLKLLEEYLRESLGELARENMRVRFIGQRSRFSSALAKLMDDMERSTQANTGTTIVIALSYGGRAEIMTAVNTLLAKGLEQADEEAFQSALWTAGLPDPDLILRTGGEKRLSNFLPYQSVYSELFFSDTFWPALSREEFDDILAEFAVRQRRMGK